MKITSTPPAINGGKDASAANGQRAQGGAKPAETRGERVHSSALSSFLNGLESRLALDGVFDAGKFNSIKRAISEGRFTVDSGLVADKMIQSAQELAGKKR